MMRVVIVLFFRGALVIATCCSSRLAMAGSLRRDRVRSAIGFVDGGRMAGAPAGVRQRRTEGIVAHGRGTSAEGCGEGVRTGSFS